MLDLFKHSVEIILQNQSPSGAYPASPNFPTYRYCWFRDGAFIAYAMDLVGEVESAARFHDWAADTIMSRENLIRRAVLKSRRGEALAPMDALHTRYALNGEAGEEEWPNFQLDGFGTWLWALGAHNRLWGGPLPDKWLYAANLTADYLASLWRLPCYDCWEEFPDCIHTYTLAAVYAGLLAEARLSGRDRRPVLTEIVEQILTQAVSNDHITKFLGSYEVDASLLGLSVPYRIFGPDDPRVHSTVARIEADLWNGGGLHRYAQDSYYGGGEWVLLAGWLGWYYAEAGELERAEQILHWIAEQADEHGHLPEQVPVNLNDPGSYEPWRQRWGEIATPLLWSHAKYIILSVAIISARYGRSL